MFRREARFAPHNVVTDGAWSVAVYVRLSDEDRNKRRKLDPSQSIENQAEYLRNYIELKNDNSEGEAPGEQYPLRIYKIYSDDDCTGMNFDRGGFRQMMQDIESNLVDCIMVKTLSRLGRNDREMQQYLKEEFEKNGREVRVCAVGDSYDSLYQDPMDMLVQFKLMINENYSQIQHTNVTIGMHTMQKKGKYIGAFAPYGYRKDPADKHHLVRDEAAAVVVERIFEEYLRGVSPREIARKLTSDGFVNPSSYKRQTGSNFVCGRKISENEKHWTSSTVKKILMDEMYTGTVVQHKQEKKKLLDKKPVAVPKKDWIRVPGMHEPLVSKEVWDTAQSMMKTIQRDVTKEDEVTIFKGVLRCGDCGHALRKKWDKYETRGGKRQKYLYYNCGTYRDYGKKKENSPDAPGCSSHYISDKLLRKIVLDDLNQIIAQIQDLTEFVERQKGKGGAGAAASALEKVIQDKEAQVKRIQGRLKRARNKWLDEEMTREEYEEVREDSQSEIHAFQAEISGLKKRISRNEMVQENPWVRELLKHGGMMELDRATVVKLISGIEVYEDRTIKITYKFSDEFDFLFAKRY